MGVTRVAPLAELRGENEIGGLNWGSQGPYNFPPAASDPSTHTSQYPLVDPPKPSTDIKINKSPSKIN